MSKSLTDAIYSDRRLNCKCGEHIADVRADAQILILANGLIVFGFLAYQCGSCRKNGRFLSPTLPDELPTLDNQFPDVKELEKRTKGISKLAFDRYRVRIRSADGKEKYVGVYESEEKAIQMRDAAVSVEMAKKLGYQFKQKQTDAHLHENRQTA